MIHPNWDYPGNGIGSSLSHTEMKRIPVSGRTESFTYTLSHFLFRLNFQEEVIFS